MFLWGDDDFKCKMLLRCQMWMKIENVDKYEFWLGWYVSEIVFGMTLNVKITSFQPWFTTLPPSSPTTYSDALYRESVVCCGEWRTIKIDKEGNTLHQCTHLTLSRTMVFRTKHISPQVYLWYVLCRPFYSTSKHSESRPTKWRNLDAS